MISNNQSNLLPPLADFITNNGLTIDVKSDRNDIRKLGPIVPNEKLNGIHLCDITFWLECNVNNLQQIKIHGWSNRQDLINLRSQPDVTQPNGMPMKKPCKRILPSQMRSIDSFIDGLRNMKNEGVYHIIPTQAN